MDFAMDTGKQILQEELSKRSFEEKGREAGVDYHVRRVKITKASFPEVKLVPVAGVGMKVLMRGVQVGGRGNVWYRYKLGWFKFTDSVDFSVKVGNLLWQYKSNFGSGTCINGGSK